MQQLKVTEAELAQLARVLDYMGRKASKSAYWASQLSELLGPAGLVERVTLLMAVTGDTGNKLP